MRYAQRYRFTQLSFKWGVGLWSVFPPRNPALSTVEKKKLWKVFRREFVVQLDYSLISAFYSTQSLPNMKVTLSHAIHRTFNSIISMRWSICETIWSVNVLAKKLHQRIYVIRKVLKLLSRALSATELIQWNFYTSRKFARQQKLHREALSNEQQDSSGFISSLSV